MTTLALPERWTFGGADLSSYATVVLMVVGADEFPSIRGDDSPLTGLHGRQSLGKLFDSRRVALTLFVSSMNAAGVDGGASQARTNLDALYAIFALRAQGALTRLMPDATTRQAQAEVVAVNSFTDTVAHHAFTLVVQFQLADPFWYGASTTGPGSQSTASSPKDFNFTPGGSFATRNLLIDFTGPQTHPRLTNTTTGAYVDVNAVVASAKHLLISPYLFTALNDGVDVIGLVTHGPTVDWLSLIPGVNALRATNTSAGGSVVVTAYPAFI